MSLTPAEIADIIKPLELVFGVLDPDKKAMYAIELQSYPAKMLTRAVAHLRKTFNPSKAYRKFPVPDDFHEACHAASAELGQEAIRQRGHCEVCGDQGWILMSGVWREETESRGADSALICSHCEVGSAILRGLQKAESEHRGKCPRTGTAQDKFENERDHEAGEKAWREWMRRKDLLAAAQDEQGGPPIDIKAKREYTESVPDDDGPIPF
jgi:hypothetical protein